MPKFLLLILCLTVAPWAQAQSLSPADTRSYHLVVTLDEPLPARRPGPNLDAGQSNHWNAWMGTDLLSEPEFYRLVGRDELAESARRIRRNRLIAMGVGTLAMITGTVLFTRGYDASRPRPAISPPHLVGGFLIPLGGMTVGLSIMTMPHRRVPLAIAQEWADTYNGQRGP